MTLWAAMRAALECGLTHYSASKILMKNAIGVFVLLVSIAATVLTFDKFHSQNKLIREQQEIIRQQKDLLTEINDCVSLADKAREMRDEQYRMLYQSFYF